jgi:hypothetical protein
MVRLPPTVISSGVLTPDRQDRRGGICNVKTQLLSSSSLNNPGDLRVDGAPSCFERRHHAEPAPTSSFVLFRSVVCSAPTTSKPLWLPSRHNSNSNNNENDGRVSVVSVVAARRNVGRLQDAKSALSMSAQWHQRPAEDETAAGGGSSAIAAAVVLILLRMRFAFILHQTQKPQGRY